MPAAAVMAKAACRRGVPGAQAGRGPGASPVKQRSPPRHQLLHPAAAARTYADIALRHHVAGAGAAQRVDEGSWSERLSVLRAAAAAAAAAACGRVPGVTGALAGLLHTPCSAQQPSAARLATPRAQERALSAPGKLTPRLWEPNWEPHYANCVCRQAQGQQTANAARGTQPWSPPAPLSHRRHLAKWRCAGAALAPTVACTCLLPRSSWLWDMNTKRCARHDGSLNGAATATFGGAHGRRQRELIHRCIANPALGTVLQGLSTPFWTRRRQRVLTRVVNRPGQSCGGS